MYNCDEKDIIKFDANFNEDFDNILLEILGNCKRLYFLDYVGFGLNARVTNSKFNKSVDLLPFSLTHIKFGYEFNCSVDNLPNRLVWLEFGHKFNCSVDMLPNTITYLVFGYDFSQCVDNLPNSLEYISFGFSFNKSIDSLPLSVIYINIGCNIYETGSLFNMTVYNLPTNIENITVYKNIGIKKPNKHQLKSNFINQLNELVEQSNTRKINT